MSARLLGLSFALVATASAQWVAVDQHNHIRAWTSDILAAHNQIRARANVPPLTWSPSLAARAQDWADYLVREGAFYHRPNPIYGENIFEIIGGSSAASEVVGDWSSEARNYNYRANTCRGNCGHYTQIVWQSTRKVGCGVATARGREVWVCNYDPPGNWVGERPY